MLKEKAGSGSRAHSRRSSASMSLQSAIPWRVALQQCPEGVKKLNIFAQETLFRDMFGHDLFRPDSLAAIEDNQSSANAIADSRC
jgi:hypothetical protein